jgi:uncharacterized repeat protein (TIGR01451 family)
MRLRKRSFLAFLVAAATLLFARSGHSQMVFYYDGSGNLTNAVLSTTTGLSTAVADGTQTITIGAPLSLGVIASGSGPITYQWRLNGVNITGATDATFFKAAVSGSDAGIYSVVTTGATGSQTNVLGTVSIVATTNTLYAVSYALSQYFAVGANGTIIASTDLIAWTAPSSGTTNNLYGIAFGNSTLVAVGAGGTVISSSSGTNWVVRNAGNVHDLMGVSFGNGIFVAVGTGGTTLTSSDGINWTTQTFDNPTMESVIYATNLFVTVGTGGSIWTSTNGVTWMAHNWLTREALNSVTYGNGIFVAVGTDGLILTSTDGSTWSARAVETLESFTSVLFFKNTFFALGPIGANFLSSDGVNWDEADSGTFEQIFGSTVGNNIPVSVGGNGTMMQIPYAVIDHFTWASINSPQRVGQSFSATVTAKDAANNTLTNFNGSATLVAWTTGTLSTNNNILGSVSPTYVATGTNMGGNAFTPNTDLLVTAVRHYDLADSISIWDEEQDLLATVSVTSVSNAWVTTPLGAPLTLHAGTTYVIAEYSRTGCYLRMDMAPTFADGTIDESFDIAGTSVKPGEFPVIPDTAFWYLVDVVYSAQRGQTNSLTPPSASFVNGVATITPSVSNPGLGVILTATDASGRTGSSNPFDVYAANDLAVTVSASPNPVTVLNNLTYSVNVVNAGPGSASSVTATNVLPANVSYVSANSTQGSCQYTNGKVTCAIGTMGSLTNVTMTIVVMPTNSGVLLTNKVSVAQSGGSDPDASNNSTSIITYVPPTLSIGDVTNYEGNVELTLAQVSISLSAPSVLAVQFALNTMDGVSYGTNVVPAIAGRDYVPLNQFVTLAPGVTNTTNYVYIQANTTVEPTKDFLVQLSNATNATFSRSQGTVYILNDDGFPGFVDSFAWSNVNSPQVTNQSFSASITARDHSGGVATNFTGGASITAINVGAESTNTLINSQPASDSATLAIYTVGYEFTPTNDLYVTHVRSYGGSKVSIWTGTGFLVASQAVASVSGKWVDTPLPAPVRLWANNVYRIGVFSDGGTYYWGNSGPTKFTDGQISGSYFSAGDSFPTNLDWPQWYLVDLRYAHPAPFSVSYSPTNTGSFTNGVWSGNITVPRTGTNFVLIADDNNGHTGVTSPFSVYQTNDMAVTLSLSPAVPLVYTNITYILSVQNPGPNTSTGVLLTNFLPTGATFISATSSQGTCTQSFGVVTCNLGSLGALSAATVTIVVTPIVAGLPLTNSVTVTRNEADPNPSNNSVVSVVIPSLAVSLALSQATDYSLTSWRSGGDNIWGSETNTTHDGTDAAQSGSVIDSQQSWVETTVRGPGTLTYWWKVSSQSNGDKLYFLTNGVAVTNISGNINWQQVNFSVAQGLTFLRWSFIEDSSIHSGSNAAWLDQVAFSIPSFSLISPAAGTNGSFMFTVTGTTGQQLVLQSSTNLVQWISLSTNTLSGGSTNFTDTSATNWPYQFYRAVFQNY